MRFSFSSLLVRKRSALEASLDAPHRLIAADASAREKPAAREERSLVPAVSDVVEKERLVVLAAAEKACSPEAVVVKKEHSAAYIQATIVTGKRQGG